MPPHRLRQGFSDSSTRLLTRHFLRRFFDNDLISPHVDLHENVALLCGGLVTASLFLSVMLASRALFGIPIPGPTAMLALRDNFFFLGASMIVMALVAAVQWDALSLDVRDTCNLGPLPVARSAIVKAKLIALLTFAAGLAAALNVMPTAVHQSLLVAKMPVGLTGLLKLVVTHAVVATLASAFGFLSVLAFRESLRIVVGGSVFARISAIVQGTLVLVLICGLLLLPGAGFRVWEYPLPPLWFLGLSETMSGGVIANVTGLHIPARLVAQNDRWLAVYHSHEPLFHEGAKLALLALTAVAILAVAAYAWNARHLPQPAPSSGRRGRAIGLLAAIFSGRDSVRRAGFTFALHALARSPAHRLSMAAAAAVALAFSVLFLNRVDFRPAPDPAVPPHSSLAVQTTILIVLLAGYRRAVRVPAELRANWAMQMACRGTERRFVAGLKRAAVVWFGLGTTIVLVPLNAWLMSPRIAAMHLLVGILLSAAFAEALFAGIHNVPLASSYSPAGNVKAVGPIAFVLFAVFLDAFTRWERRAMTEDGLIPLLATLAAMIVAFRLLEFWRQRDPARPAIKFEEAPEPSTQWLGLSG